MSDYDPYAVLGVTRSALPGAIKSAYRRRVQTSHPDRGGDAEEFMAIVKAFGILSDPEAKRLFDEAGIVDEEGIKSYRREVTLILADMFDAAVRSAMQTRLKLNEINFIEHMTKVVRSSAFEARRSVDKLNEEIEALSALRGRIKRNDEQVNLFVERLNAQIREKTEAHAQARRRVAMLETAVVELGNYENEVELISALESSETA